MSADTFTNALEALRPANLRLGSVYGGYREASYNQIRHGCCKRASPNGIGQGFGLNLDHMYLVGFYLEMARIYDWLKGDSQRLCERVTAGIYGIHFTANQATYGENAFSQLDGWK
ncbi:unnamed protein product [Phytophthora fragariaefolia]|uniref:Unnamed protein product n=1 Tax=Phytophthora fragariaefolia TaxID=1490495 RepID=A0A9W6Y245_9STRA|nr:unnamed protein product [Phytophthora fragariaefolia]